MTDHLLHFKYFERSRNVVVSSVVWRGCFWNVVERTLRQPRQYAFGHVAAVGDISTWLAVFDRHSLVSIRTSQVGRQIEMEDVIAERRAFRGVGIRSRINCLDLVRTCPVGREFNI